MGEKRNFYVLCFVTLVAFAINLFFMKTPVAPIEEADEIKQEEVTKHTIPTKDEKFYVLQNEYQQMVFSNIGGAIAEINLSLKGKIKNENIVQSIDLDKKILQNNPENSNFPNHQALIVNDSGSQEPLEPSKGGYTPLIRRDIMNKDGKTEFKIDPNFYAMQLDSEDQTIYKIKEFTKDKIVFTGLYNGKQVQKSYSFTKAENATIPYTLKVEVDVEGEKKGLWLSSGIPEAELISSSFTPSLKYLNVEKAKKAVKSINLPKDEETTTSVTSAWSVNSNGFFGLILDPLAKKVKKIKALKIDGQEAPSRLSLLDKHEMSEFCGYQLFLPLQKGSDPSSFFFYAGPLQKKLLTSVDSSIAAIQNEKTPNFTAVTESSGWFSFIGKPISNALSLAMNFFHNLTGSWGLAIILLTLLIRILLYPLQQRGITSAKKLSELKPKIDSIQAKYKNDPQTSRNEIALLYRNARINPLSAVAPHLVQIPLFITMFSLMRTSFDLRGASFIPGWIDSLSASDVLFSWGFHIPFIGEGLHILPLINMALMMLQQKVTAMSSPQQKNDSSNPMSGKKGMIFMAAISLLFYTMPSGLNIYMIVSTGFAVIQQYFANKKLKKPLLSKKLRQ